MQLSKQIQDLAHQNSETATRWHTKLQNLDDADLVGHIKSVIVWCKLHVSLLLAIGPDQSVDLLRLDVIHLLNGCLDLLLVRLEVNDEDKGVVVFNLLHRRLSRKGVFEDLVLIKLVPPRCTDSWVLGVPWLLEGLGPVKRHRCADLLVLPLGGSRLNSLGNLQGLSLAISLLRGSFRRHCSFSTGQAAQPAQGGNQGEHW